MSVREVCKERIEMIEDPNVRAVVDKHLKRAETGLVKYGVDTSRTDLTRLSGWCICLRS